MTEMNLQQRLQRGIDEGIKLYYDDVSVKLKDRSRFYDELKAVSPQSKNEMVEAIKKVNPGLLQNLQKLYDDKEKQVAPIKEQVKSLDELAIDVALQQGDGRSLLVIPVKESDLASQYGLAQAIYAHVEKAVRSLDAGYRPTDSLGYRGFSFSAIEGERLSAALKSSNPDLDQVNVALNVVQWSVSGLSPIGGHGPLERVTLEMTPGDLEYSLIRPRVENKGFFPGYKQNFRLTSNVGETTAWMTSRPDGSRRKGNYVVGNLGPLFDALKLNPGDSLVIEQVEPKQVYRIVDVVRSGRKK